MSKSMAEVKPAPARPRTARLFCLASLLASLALGGACTRHDELLGTLLGDGGATVDTSVPLATPPSFQTPTLVAALSDVDSIDEDPTFTGDLLELYFMSTRAGSKDIWRSQRASADAPWGAPTAVAELNSSNDEWCPGISLDGLTLWFATDRAAGRGQLWQATRATRTDAWSAPAAVAELASNSVDFGPVVDATETMLFFSSDRANLAGTTEGTSYDLYWSSRPSVISPWGAPQPVPGVNSSSDEYDPFVAQGGLVIFFTSMRSGSGDIYWSARQSISEPFEAPVLLTDIDSTSYDSDSSLSPDLSYMMFSSTRSGNAEVYETHAVR
jgi:Tol biopolymer transport system component